MHTSGLEAVIAKISSRVSEDAPWQLKTSELEELVPPVNLYRAAYESGLLDRDAFGPATTGELLSLLEAAGYPDSETRFREAGLFLNHEDRLEVTERLVRRIRTAIVIHVPEPEVFRSMIREFRRYEVAEQVYCETYLPLGHVVEECADESARGAAREVHVRTLRWYLQSLVDRRIIAVAELAPALFDLLRTIARQEGALPPLHETQNTAEPVRVPAEQAARAVLDLSPGFSRRDLRVRYRSLMRRYHPDINPSGLEMSKKINAAYALLLTSVGET